MVHAYLFLTAEANVCCKAEPFRLGGAAITLIFSCLGFLASQVYGYVEFVHLGNLSADARVPPIGIVKYEHRHSCRPPSVKCARAFDDHVREFIRRLRVSRSHGYSGLPHSRSVDLIELIRFENPASRHAYSHALTYFQELSRFLQRRDYRGATEMDLPD